MSGNTWPEQEVVERWWQKRSLELKEALTRLRPPKPTQPIGFESRECIVCKKVRQWGVWCDRTGACVCVGCSNAARQKQSASEDSQKLATLIAETCIGATYYPIHFDKKQCATRIDRYISKKTKELRDLLKDAMALMPEFSLRGPAHNTFIRKYNAWKPPIGLVSKQ
jgi:hypothetical protein